MVKRSQVWLPTLHFRLCSLVLCSPCSFEKSCDLILCGSFLILCSSCGPCSFEFLNFCCLCSVVLHPRGFMQFCGLCNHIIAKTTWLCTFIWLYDHMAKKCSGVWFWTLCYLQLLYVANAVQFWSSVLVQNRIKLQCGFMPSRQSMRSMQLMRFLNNKCLNNKDKGR